MEIKKETRFTMSDEDIKTLKKVVAKIKRMALFKEDSKIKNKNFKKVA